jgi:sterol desaturase/sphingolipid hydroxylase (fatty acid hydroxylase superfamily)
MSSPLALAAILFVAFGKFLLVGLMTVAVRAIPALARRRVYRIEHGAAQRRAELEASWVVPLDGVALAACLHLGWLVPAEPGLGASLLTLAVLSVGFEAWFSITHRLMHTALLYPMHARHHEAGVVGATSGLRFSPAEKLVLTLGSVGLAAAASHVLPITLPGLVAFFAVYYTASIVGHSNVEVLPPSLVRSPVGRVVATPTFHALHHSRMSGHYGLMSPLLDSLWGTVFADYPDVHARAWAGHGLARLGALAASGAAARSRQSPRA